MKGRHYWNRITDAVQLQAEPLPGLPLVEIAGDCRVLIEYHCGVMKYDRQLICIKISFGRIEVSGCDLQLSHMTREQLVITGKINSVCLARE